jgi:EAL domain-containing protein (putative c-di-GMP-specific phosphodiesterase class I)
VTPAAIREVIAAGGPHILYQPIKDITRDRIEGYEALSRFDDGNPPNLWFAAACSEGLGVELELAAVQAAVRDFRRALGGFRPELGYLSVNLTPKALLDGRVQDFLTEADENVPIRIVIELSETQMVTDYPALVEAVTLLRRGGIVLSIDDLGAGHSSLLHVARLHPEHIKIDIAFTSRVPDDDDYIAVVSTLVALARHIGSHLVAEGVETQVQSDALRILGAASQQGFFIGLPGPLPEAV